ADSSSFWGSLPSLSEMGAHPAVSSALDNVALSLGDVLDAATQDLSEMAGDIKSFVASAVGMEETEDDPEQQRAAATKKVMESVSPRSRQEAASAISDFCQKYPAARVRPNTQELEKLWAAICSLKPVALNSAFYEELSFTNGDTSWQPRLRVLYAVEYLFRKEGMGKEVAVSVFHQARSLIFHLTEVQQCAEKAQEVIKLLTTRKEVQEEAKAKPAAKAAAPAKKTEAPDLLDMSAPVASSAPAAAPAPAPSLDVDLLGEPVAPVAPSVAPVPSPAPAPVPAVPVAESSPLSPSAALALALSSAPMAATATLPQDLDLLAPNAAPATTPAKPDLPFNLGTTAGFAQPSLPKGFPAQMSIAAKATPAPLNLRGKQSPYMPMPSIPSALDSPQPVVDQFAFVSDLTGIGGSNKK
ncbi:sqd, partial [Symbiodinium pilosum]